MSAIRSSRVVHTSVAVALFAILYRYWLVAPVLKYVSMGQWRFFAVMVAVASGGLLSLLRLPQLALAGASMAGLLLGGTWAEWKFPNDVAISVYAAFASHLQFFWRQMLMLTFAATLGATVPNLSKNRVKASVKAIALIAISLAFAAVALAYSTAKGYTSWFVRVWHPIITVNGIRSEGWLHRTHGGKGIFLTEHNSSRSVTYELVFTDSGEGHVWSCGEWVAPRWPAIPIGDVSPPCSFLGGYAGHSLTGGTNSVSFTTPDGRKLQADW